MGRRMGGRLYFGPAYWYLRKPIPWFKWKMEKGKEEEYDEMGWVELA